MLATNPDSHPWASARDRFNDSVLPRLREHGKAIGAAADAGDAKAKQIMDHYQMLYRSFDPLTLTMLDETLTAYLAKTSIGNPAGHDPSEVDGTTQPRPARMGV